MIRTRVCDLLEIDHPIALGGMGGGHTQPNLVAAVSEAGALGAFGVGGFGADQVRSATAAIRERTLKPFALNVLLFLGNEDGFVAALDEHPAVMAFAWPKRGQDLKPYFDRAHGAGCKVTFMTGDVTEARRGAEAGADVIIAQGVEAGGHVSWMAMSVIVPMVIDAVAPLPVLAAGGIADGRGLAASLALGADGVLLGTRFLATEESPLHANFKQAIVDSDGHDTMLTEIPDIATGTVWPGAMARALRNKFVERWAGQEWALRQHQEEVAAGLLRARENGDTDEGALLIGQDAGLIHDIPSAGQLIGRMAREAEAILSDRLTGLLQSTSKR